MQKLKSTLLDLDQMIKVHNIHPYEIVTWDKVVFHINHNPAILNQITLVSALYESLLFTNQTAAIHPAKKSYSSFKIRQGMELSLLTTLRGAHIKDIYLKYMFLVLPYNILDPSFSKTLFKKTPSNSNFHITGINLTPHVTGNLVFVLHSTKPNLSLIRFVNSFWGFPIP